jgi:hypothetical protein
VLLLDFLEFTEKTVEFRVGHDWGVQHVVCVIGIREQPAQLGDPLLEIGRWRVLGRSIEKPVQRPLPSSRISPDDVCQSIEFFSGRFG